ncbi:MAG TPA: hypothetical protein VE596_03440 [Gaiellaceae bacterium]|jgi:hypothetical protein|nr:hypothetical protein [Gaiellaceae bacterium]
MSGRAPAVVGVCAVLLAGCGAGKEKTPAPGVVIGHDTVRGAQQAASASADGGEYSTFAARVTASPNQRVTGGWVITCRNFNSTSRDAGDFARRTPFTVRMDTTNADAQRAGGGATCTVVATASLTRSGRVTVKLLGGQ